MLVLRPMQAGWSIVCLDWFYMEAFSCFVNFVIQNGVIVLHEVEVENVLFVPLDELLLNVLLPVNLYLFASEAVLQVVL
jgi:hypothetical protein